MIKFLLNSHLLLIIWWHIVLIYHLQVYILTFFWRLFSKALIFIITKFQITANNILCKCTAQNIWISRKATLLPLSPYFCKIIRWCYYLIILKLIRISKNKYFILKFIISGFNLIKCTLIGYFHIWLKYSLITCNNPINFIFTFDNLIIYKISLWCTNWCIIFRFIFIHMI